MTVQDVMTRRVVTIGAGESIAHARTKMRDAGVHQLVVCSREGRAIGVIGAADVREVPDHGAVRDFMSRKLLFIRPDTSVSAAAAFMREHAIGSLPVLRGTRLVGIVTVSDMLDVVDDAHGRLHELVPAARARRRRGR